MQPNEWGWDLYRFKNTIILIPIQLLEREFSGNPYTEVRTFSLDTLPQEYPQYKNTFILAEPATPLMF
ncbi:hypothetical protein ABES80_16530 [Bacillus gobiensis]|uniref:hypothetical protein n=1 Tax=Bacillus gobiensis TaxID=1441095 RepID=UPI003D1B6BE2